MRSTSGAVRSYLNCQIFMVTRHQRRLSGFEREASGRLAAIVEREESRGVGAAAQEMIQLLADTGKMRRRCKHILDVTDRYCVLTAEDLKIKSSSSPRMSHRARSLEEIPEESEEADVSPDDPDFPMQDFSSPVAATAASAQHAPVGSTLSAPASSPITQNIVKSTFESFGSHLAVIAKTYTRKRGHSAETSPASSSSPPPPASEGASSSSSSSSAPGPSKIGIFSKHRQRSVPSSLGV